MDENEYPVYKSEDGSLFAYCPDTGHMYILKPGDYMGDVGKPMPGRIPKRGNMTMLGIFKLGD